MGACLCVEVNTWLLIARRVFNKHGFVPWTFDFRCISIRVKLISVLFYVTWIAIRYVCVFLWLILCLGYDFVVSHSLLTCLLDSHF